MADLIITITGVHEGAAGILQVDCKVSVRGDRTKDRENPGIEVPWPVTEALFRSSLIAVVQSVMKNDFPALTFVPSDKTLLFGGPLLL